MPRKMRDRETGQYLVMYSVQEVARVLGVGYVDVEHWIAHQLVNVHIQLLPQGGEEYWIEPEEIKAIKEFFSNMPNYWSKERTLWYRFFASHQELRTEVEAFRHLLETRSMRSHAQDTPLEKISSRTSQEIPTVRSRQGRGGYA